MTIRINHNSSTAFERSVLRQGKNRDILWQLDRRSLVLSFEINIKNVVIAIIIICTHRTKWLVVTILVYKSKYYFIVCSFSYRIDISAKRQYKIQ